MRLLSPARTASLVAAGALATATLAMATPAAHAGVLDTPVSQATVTFNSSGACTTSGPGNTMTNGTFAADGVPVTTTATSSQTVTGADPTDVTQLAGTATNKITATQAAGALKTIDVEASFQASLTTTKGAAQACNAAVAGGSINAGSFDLPVAKYLTVEIDSKRAVGVITFISAAGPIEGASQTLTYSLHSHTTQRIYLPAGTWTVQNQNQGSLSAPTPTSSQPSTKTTSVKYHISFDTPGAATTAAEGDGKKYLTLADGRSCASASLTGEWKSKAGKGKNRKIKKAVFYVNDVKVKTVKKPKKKTITTLTGLDPDQPADVEVRIKLAKKPKNGDRKLTLERSYLPCT